MSLKYVIFQVAEGMPFQPVIMPEHVTHSAVSIEGAKPVSAGFFDVAEGCNPFGKSESLALSPHPRDAALLQATLLNMGMYAFLEI